MISDRPHSHRNGSMTNEQNFHGAAIIDRNGREIPITESMVRQALAMLAERHTGLSAPSVFTST